MSQQRHREKMDLLTNTKKETIESAEEKRKQRDEMWATAIASQEVTIKIQDVALEETTGNESFE